MCFAGFASLTGTPYKLPEKAFNFVVFGIFGITTEATRLSLTNLLLLRDESLYRDAD